MLSPPTGTREPTANNSSAVPAAVTYVASPSSS